MTLVAVDRPSITGRTAKIIARHRLTRGEGANSRVSFTQMERPGGWYKRRTRTIPFAAAPAAAAALNAAALHVTAALRSRLAMTDALAAALGNGGVPPKDALARSDADSLIGRAGWPAIPATPRVVLMPLGRGAAAAPFGAPFCFDTLQRIAWMRGACDAAGRGRAADTRDRA